VSTPPGEDQFVTREEQAADDAEKEVAAAIAAGVTAAALALLISKMTKLLEQARVAAIRLGGASVIPPRRASGRRRRARRARIPATARLADVAGRVRDAISIAAVDLNGGTDPKVVADKLTRRLRQLAATIVCEGISAGVEAAARALGAAGLMWVTETGPCDHCAKLAGTVVGFNEKWPDPGVGWHRYKGRPPLHPNCRCRPRPVWTKNPIPPEQALRRGARRRAGRRTN
jgi:hypothetical protein